MKQVLLDTVSSGIINDLWGQEPVLGLTVSLPHLGIEERALRGIMDLKTNLFCSFFFFFIHSFFFFSPFSFFHSPLSSPCCSSDFGVFLS